MTWGREGLAAARCRRALGSLFALALGACSTEPTPPTPPLSGKIVFAAPGGDTVNGRSVLYAMDTDGSGVEQIPIPLPPGFAYPDVNPDGEHIAFTDGGIFTVRSVGSDLRYIISDAAAVRPRWSSDGKYITYDNDSDIWVANADGSAPINVTNSDSIEESFPDWSPDGQWLAYGRRQSGPGLKPIEIWVVKRDGADPHRVVGDSMEQALFATYSPDGAWIVYDVSLGGAAPSELRLVHPDGTDEHAILVSPDSGATQPAWSPDGQFIAFEYGHGIAVIRPDGTGLRMLISGLSYARSPEWGPPIPQHTRE